MEGIRVRFPACLFSGHENVFLDSGWYERDSWIGFTNPFIMGGARPRIERLRRLEYNPESLIQEQRRRPLRRATVKVRKSLR